MVDVCGQAADVILGGGWTFVVMQQEGVTEALTGDKHFEQAGFIALLK